MVVNRAARHEYEIVDRFEAGLALLGSEVKSLRGGRGNLKEAFVRLDGREAFLVGCHISPYPWANRENHDPTRQRKLLLNRSELLKLKRGTAEKGMTVVPLRLYLKGSKIKLEIALARGRKSHDKRQAIKERDAQREMSRDRE
ncbi:MAG: SsrA-binding protein SmpB [Deltaproteobacteria bacterium]|nr:SsrA-binding protein SmpB [Deltaproteobacteria bacterium]